MITVAGAAGGGGALILACCGLLCYRCLRRKRSRQPLLRNGPRQARGGVSSLAYTQGMLHVVNRGGASAAQPRTDHGRSELLHPRTQPYEPAPPPQSIAAAPALARLAVPASIASTVPGPMARGRGDSLTERFSRESLTERFSVLSQTTERFSDVEFALTEEEFAPADAPAAELRRTTSLMSHNI